MIQRSLYIIVTLLTSRQSHAQHLVPASTVDTIPTIRTFQEELSLLDKIRCATYLFTRDFHVSDSLGNIYITQYLTDDFIQLHEPELESRVDYIHLVTYLFAFHDRIDYMKEVYKNLVVTTRNEKGNTVSSKYFEIVPHQYQLTYVLNNIIKMLRLPVTYHVTKNTFTTYFHCIDPEEQSQYCRSFLLILYKLHLLHRKWHRWKGIFINCSNRQQAVTYELKLPQ